MTYPPQPTANALARGLSFRAARLCAVASRSWAMVAWALVVLVAPNVSNAGFILLGATPSTTSERGVPPCDASLLALGTPEVLTPELLLALAAQSSTGAFVGGSSSGSTLSTGNENPVESDEQPVLQFGWDTQACLPVGDGGCGGSPSSTTGGAQSPGAAITERFCLATSHEMNERLSEFKLLIPPKPNPNEMLDPPRVAS